MMTGDCMDTVGTIQTILVFEHITVRMEVEPRMEVKL